MKDIKQILEKFIKENDFSLIQENAISEFASFLQKELEGEEKKGCGLLEHLVKEGFYKGCSCSQQPALKEDKHNCCDPRTCELCIKPQQPPQEEKEIEELYGIFTNGLLLTESGADELLDKLNEHTRAINKLLRKK